MVWARLAGRRACIDPPARSPPAARLSPPRLVPRWRLPAGGAARRGLLGGAVGPRRAYRIPSRNCLAQRINNAALPLTALEHPRARLPVERGEASALRAVLRISATHRSGRGASGERRGARCEARADSSADDRAAEQCGTTSSLPAINTRLNSSSPLLLSHSSLGLSHETQLHLEPMSSVQSSLSPGHQVSSTPPQPTRVCSSLTTSCNSLIISMACYLHLLVVPLLCQSSQRYALCPTRSSKLGTPPTRPG